MQCVSVTCVFGLFLVLLVRKHCLFVFVFFPTGDDMCVWGCSMCLSVTCVFGFIDDMCVWGCRR